jgi:hypothetical protein
MFESAQRKVDADLPCGAVAKEGWLLEREEYRTLKVDVNLPCRAVEPIKLVHSGDVAAWC